MSNPFGFGRRNATEYNRIVGEIATWEQEKE
jgi:hypothetical protein